MERLTTSELDLYNYLVLYIDLNGYAPTVREMRKVFRCNQSTLYLKLNELERKGYIIRMKRNSRAIKLIEFTLQKKHMDGENDVSLQLIKTAISDFDTIYIDIIKKIDTMGLTRREVAEIVYKSYIEKKSLPKSRKDYKF